MKARRGQAAPAACYDRVMRIATLNCNGIRAAARKGFYGWLPKQDLDVICLQETRCTDEDLTPPEFSPRYPTPLPP